MTYCEDIGVREKLENPRSTRVGVVKTGEGGVVYFTVVEFGLFNLGPGYNNC